MENRKSQWPLVQVTSPHVLLGSGLLASKMVSVVLLIYPDSSQAQSRNFIPVTPQTVNMSADLSDKEFRNHKSSHNPDQSHVYWLGVCKISMAGLLACCWGLPEAQRVFLLLWAASVPFFILPCINFFSSWRGNSPTVTVSGLNFSLLLSLWLLFV